LPAVLDTLTINSDSDSVPIGLAVDLSCTAAYTDGDTNDVTKETSWSVSDPDIAEVLNSQTSKDFTVTAATIVDVNLTSPYEVLQVDSILQLTLIATLSDDTTQNITG